MKIDKLLILFPLLLFLCLLAKAQTDSPFALTWKVPTHTTTKSERMSQIDHLQIAPAKEMGKSLMISLESLRKEALLAGPFVSEERRLSRRTKFVVPKDTAVLVKKVEPPTYYQGPAFRIYPNPATDFVQLEVSDEALWGQPVIFVDRKGEVVLRTQTDSSGNLKQSLDSFKAGIYLVGIKKPTGWGFRQLVIQ